MITYQGGVEGQNKRRNIPKPRPYAQTYIGPRAPNFVGADMNERLRRPSSQYGNVGMDMNERLARQREQQRRDRVNQAWSDRLNAQYRAWYKQWQDRVNGAWSARLNAEANYYQSYVPPEEQPQYNGGNYANWGDWGGGGGGGGSTYQAPPPEWYLQSVVWKI